MRILESSKQRQMKLYLLDMQLLGPIESTILGWALLWNQSVWYLMIRRFKG